MGIKTGIFEIDDVLGELPEGTVSILAAGAGCFKTTTLTSITYDMVVNQKKNVLYLTLESMVEHQNYNFISRHSLELGIPVPSYEIKTMKLNEQNDINFKKSVQDFYNKTKNKLFVFGYNDMEITGIEGLIKNTVDHLKEKSETLDAIVIDYLQLLKYSIGLKKGMELVEQVCKDYNLVGIIASQLNREESRKINNKTHSYTLKEERNYEKLAYNTILLNQVGHGLTDSLYVYVIKKDNVLLENVDPKIVYVNSQNYCVGNPVCVMSNFNSIYQINYEEIQTT